MNVTVDMEPEYCWGQWLPSAWESNWFNLFAFFVVMLNLSHSINKWKNQKPLPVLKDGCTKQWLCSRYAMFLFQGVTPLMCCSEDVKFRGVRFTWMSLTFPEFVWRTSAMGVWMKWPVLMVIKIVFVPRMLPHILPALYRMTLWPQPLSLSSCFHLSELLPMWIKSCIMSFLFIICLGINDVHPTNENFF